MPKNKRSNNDTNRVTTYFSFAIQSFFVKLLRFSVKFFLQFLDGSFLLKNNDIRVSLPLGH